MISIVRSFGAPVIEPPGKAARMQSTRSASSRSRPRTVGDELVHGRVGLDDHERRHVDAAELADAAEVVAQQVDDHQVLGAVLLVVAQRGAAVGVLGRVGGARGGALDRLAPRRIRSRSTRRKRSGEELSTDSVAEAQ